MIREKSSQVIGCCFLRLRTQMELATLSKNYGEFYAPSYAVKIKRDDLMRDLLVSISQVEVDLQLGTASRFSFTITDAYSHKLHSFRTGRGDELLGILGFGAEVDVCMGYGDAKSTPVAISGLITGITTSFPEGGSREISVGGVDRGFPMTLAKSPR